MRFLILYILKLFLYPFSILYGIIVICKNYLYDIKIFSSHHFNFPIIGVGNLSVGGTGKTPHIEYFIRLLSTQYKIATLSRGYGRKTKGLMIGKPDATAEIIGDEPMQFYIKYKEKISVVVAESRIKALFRILSEKLAEVILLDDCFQHRAVLPGLNILLTEYRFPFYHDKLLPYGRLRETCNGAKRANIIIVSKCPSKISIEKKQLILEKIRKYTTTDIPVFFSGIRYMSAVPLFSSKKKLSKKIILLTGIANSNLLKEYLKTHFIILKHFCYTDHYHYSLKTIKNIITFYQKIPEKTTIITTEKDATKLYKFKKILGNLSIYHLPIEIYFLEKEEILKNMIFDYITKYFE